MPGTVLDTSSIVAQIDDEPGADDVDALLDAARTGSGVDGTGIVIPFVALMEVEYRLLRRSSAEQAERVLRVIDAWPVTVIESNPSWRHAAAAIKARYRLSLADAWIAALALMRDVELVHKDPEFDQIPDLKVIRLPYKPRSG